MTYRLPPLNALRAFEAAARHLSFKRAGAELHVTPGAISQHVKALEEQLGVVLFERIHNGLVLTEEGQRYVAPLRSAFATISIATESVAPRRDGPEIVVGTDPEFAIHWLVTRLDRFARAGNGVRVKIAEAQAPAAVLGGEVDIALLNGVSSHPELQVEPFLEERLMPAASPQIPDALSADRFGRDMPLLVADDGTGWRQWLAAADRPGIEHYARVDFAERDLAVRAAELGRGVLLSSTISENPALDAGRLIAAAGEPQLDGDRWYLLCPPGRVDCPEEAAFISWLKEEGAAVSGDAANGLQVTEARSR